MLRFIRRHWPLMFVKSHERVLEDVKDGLYARLHYANAALNWCHKEIAALGSALTAHEAALKQAHKKSENQRIALRCLGNAYVTVKQDHVRLICEIAPPF